MAASSVLGMAVTAAAEPSGRLDSVETRDGIVRVLFSLPGLPDGVAPDLSSVEVDIDGAAQPVTAELATDAGDSVRRSTVLAIDVSDSMAGARFRAARQAALAFIDQAPADVSIGVVSFAGEVTTVQAPTQDRAAVRSAVKQLDLQRGTLLYQGIEKSLAVLAGSDAGNVLVLSDGSDTSGTRVPEVVSAIEGSDIRVDVVALEQTGADLAILRDLAAAGSGQVVNADDVSLGEVFSQQAAQLESQVLISLDIPDGWDGGDATLTASLTAADQTYSDEALVNIAADTASVQPSAPQPTELEAAPGPRLAVSRPVMIGGIVALALGGVTIVLLASNSVGGREKQTLRARLSPYAGDQAGKPTGRRAETTHSPSMKQQAVELTEKAISSGVDLSLARRLDAAGLKLNSAEWLLMQAGIAVAAAAAGFLVSGGALLPTLVLLLVGAAGPWVYLSFKRSRRLKAFNSQLADTLQLISGSLSAGLSLAQSLDTVVREGNEPVAGEFRRALVEQRLGVEIETALEGVAERMGSDDFAWVVMAIRIQRQVGGNLAELLNTVAATLREREYLRRQVSVLSAEGRLSAYILGGLPPLFVTYLALARPTYLAPMYTTSLGLLMSGSAAVMMVVGIFWLKKSVKVEV
ncbi:MAG: type II secretion system F family protein [Nocardioidaceae bacterium]|nr:type II secretion system F family protein [Nocardioidaceae bacterium]